MRVELMLPWPPSTNRIWRCGRFKAFRSPAYMEWRELAAEAVSGLPEPEPYLGRVSMTLRLYAPSRRRYDIANREKAVADFLESAGFIADDEQIDRTVIQRGHVNPRNGLAWVILQAMAGADCPDLPEYSRICD